MDALYPNLRDKFKTEGVCPICLMEMELTPRFSCANGHTVCYRCKPYYFNCPTCQSPLEVEVAPVQMPMPMPMPHMPPPPTHFMPHRLPPQFRERNPSAPPMQDFLAHERHSWGPPPPTENQELISCSYSHLGCWVKVPIYLKQLHESRCQFRPHLEEEHLPTDLPHSNDDLIECVYRSAGCNVRMPPWRKGIHDKYCIYKERFETMHGITEGLGSVNIDDDDVHGDPDELVHCRYRRFGCMVKMPRRRKRIHEQKCNYQRDDDYCSYDEPDPPSQEFDPEEQVDCKWAENGCRVKPKRYRKEVHEEKCNYRLEECSFKDYGCEAIFDPAARYAHEKSCDFAR